MIYWYFPIWASADISGDLVELSMDQVTWATAEHQDPPPDVVAAYIADSCGPAGLGDPQWVRILTGPLTVIALSYGSNIVHGRLTDTPETPYFKWTVRVPKD